MDRGKQDLVLGIVFFVGLGLLLYATYSLTRLFGTPERIQMYFPNAAGLRKGDPVYVLGSRLGEVTRVEYKRGNARETAIEVSADLDAFVSFREDKTIVIKNSTLLGGKMIEIDPGVGSELAPGVLLAGDVSDSLMADLLEQPDIQRIINGVIDVIDKLQSEDGVIHLLFTDAEFKTKFNDTFDSLSNSIVAVEQGEGTLRKLIHEPETADALDRIVNNVETLTANVNDPAKGLVGKLTNDPQVNQDFDTLVDDLTEFTGAINDVDNGGVVAELVHGEDLRNRVNEVVDGVNEAVDKINDPDAGLIGKAVSDPALAKKLDEIVEGVDQVIADVRDQRGLLGRIISDEEMGRQFTRILNQVSRAIEDAREAAPIGTFFQVLSGAF